MSEKNIEERLQIKDKICFWENADDKEPTLEDMPCMVNNIFNTSGEPVKCPYIHTKDKNKELIYLKGCKYFKDSF